MKRDPSDAASGITVTFDPSACEAHESPPPFTFRHRIIPAIQELVAERFGHRVPDLAVLCAAVTARSANQLLPGERVPYEVFAGSVLVRLPGEAADPGGGSESARSVHAWAGRIHPSGRKEVADLSSRYLGSWLVASRSLSEVRFPRAIWAFEDEVPRAFRYLFDAAATEQVRAGLEGSRAEAVVAAVREVLERFCSGSTGRASPASGRTLRSGGPTGGVRGARTGAGDEG